MVLPTNFVIGSLLHIVFPFRNQAYEKKHQNTNVVKFFGLLDKSSPLEQVVYYQVRHYELSERSVYFRLD